MSDDIAGVLLAIAAGVDEEAIRRAGAAADRSAPGSPEHRLADALRRHLDGGRGDVYDDPAAFERFVDGGGNVELYRRAHHALAERHAHHRPRSVLDVGCGDGRLTRAALRPGLTRLDLVEPSAELLAAAEARLAPDLGATSLVPHPGTAQDLVAGLPDDADRADDADDDAGRWDVAQSTFALHALQPDDRHRLLSALAGRVRRLLVVEFDVPPFADRGLDHARYAAGRYVEGVAEYAGDDLVVDGFLVPVLAGQFAPDRPRHTWEQPVDAWVADLAAAGFTDVRATLLHRYWWAPAHLLEATGAAGGQ